MGKMKTKVIAGVLSAVMMTGTVAATAIPAGAAVGINRLNDSITAYPELLQEIKDYYVAELNQNRTVKKELRIERYETLYIPAGKTLTLNKGARIYGTVYIENGGELKTKGGLYVWDGGSVVCDGKMTFTRESSLHVGDNSLFYASPKSSLRFLTEYLYSDDNNSVACLGKVTTTSNTNAEKKSAFCPTIIGAVRTTNDVVGDVHSSEALSAEDALKAVTLDWYTLSEPPIGGMSEYVTVLFSNGCPMKFGILGDRLLTIYGTSVRDIWYFQDQKYGYGEDYSLADPLDENATVSGVKFSAVRTDQLISGSTNVVRAKLTKVEKNQDSADYWFEAVEQLKGETPAKFRVPCDFDEVGEFTQEFREGTEYLLFLKAVDNVYEDIYYVLYDGVIIPVDNEKISRVAVRGTVTTVEDGVSTMEKIRARVKANEKYDDSQPVGGDYIHSTDIDYIVKGSPYIAKVKFTGESETYGARTDRRYYKAEVLNSYKLPVGEDGVTKIMLSTDSVEVGKEYIVLVYKDGRLTSRNSIYSADDTAILEALKKAGLQ